MGPPPKSKKGTNPSRKKHRRNETKSSGSTDKSNGKIKLFVCAHASKWRERKEVLESNNLKSHG